jgi:glutamyl-tRNA synthetase
MTVITRFAPSPTGFLHIGGARTALFNWLFTRHHGGKFLLRIEDTDRARSTEPAVEAILNGLRWLGLDWDDEVVFQFSRMDRHAEAAKSLLASGRAYYCYASKEELEAMRAEQAAKNLPLRYDGRWRDRDPADAPPGIQPVLRLKAPQTGETTVHDLVRGDATVANAQLDDMVLLRGDGTPTYMLSVVVDDHDYGITHVMRADDHFTNTFRQIQLYNALDWQLPQFAHLPLILGPDGAKLSKRHGAPATETYRDMGYLAEAMRNYLMRLGWSHGDDEIISTAQAIEWFDTDGMGKSPARFDFQKLDNVNAHYIRETDDAILMDLARPFFDKLLARSLSEAESALLLAAMPMLKSRAKTLLELAISARFLLERSAPDEKATALIAGSQPVLRALATALEKLPDFTAEAIEAAARDLAEAQEIKLGAIAQPLRAALSGSTVSPPIFEVAALLGRQETLARLEAAIS